MFIDKIIQIFNFIKNYYLIIVTVLMVIFMVLFLRECRDNKDLKAKSEQNVSALTDKLSQERNKSGELLSRTTAFAATLDELKKLNIDLYNELKKEKGDYITFTKLQQLFNKKDTIRLTDTVIKYPEDIFGLKWDYKRDTTGFYQYLSGETKCKVLYDSTKLPKDRITLLDKGTNITKNSLGFDAYINVKRDQNNKVVVTAKTFNDEISIYPITTIDPSILSPKKDNWILSTGVGAGLQKSLNSSNFNAGWGLYIVFGYRLYSF